MPNSRNDSGRPASRSIVFRFLTRLSRAVIRYPRLFFYPQAILLLCSILYTVEKLEFSTSRNDLVGADKQYHKIFLEFREEFPGQDDLIAVVESEDMEKNRQFVERLGMRLEAETNVFSEVFFKGDLKLMGPKALLFLPEETLSELLTTLKDYRPFVEQFCQATNLTFLFDLVNRRFSAANKEQNADNSALIKAFPALRRIIRQAEASLERPGLPPSPGIDALFGAGAEAERRKYITFGNGRLYLVSAKAHAGGSNEAAVRTLREMVKLVQAEVPGVNVGVTGEPVLEMDEMAQSQSDSLLASIISLIIVITLFMYAYKETGRPVKATACLLVGIGYTMAYTTAVVGHLNILTIAFVPMLIGLAIDFGLHLISRYEEELRLGHPSHQALETAMTYSGMGIFTGCLTTAGAFFAMGITDFKGVQEMGIICGGGLLICVVPMMTLLPVLLLRGSQNQIDMDRRSATHSQASLEKRERLERLWLDRPGPIFWATLAVSIVAAFHMPKVRFDYNLLHMQSKGLPAVEFEKKIVQSAGKSVLYAAVVADSLEAARLLQSRLMNLNTVSSVDSMAQYLGVDATKQLALIEAIRAEVSTIRFAEIDTEDSNVRELDQTLWSLRGYLGLASHAVTSEIEAASRKQDAAGRAESEKLSSLLEQIKELRTAINGLRHRMNSLRDSEAEHKLGLFQQALFGDIHETFNAIRSQDSTSGLTTADLPAALRNRFIGKSGRKYLLQVYPKEDVWNREAQEAFVKELRTVAPHVTGTPVQLYEYTTLLKKSYEQAAWYSLGAIAILVFIHFRSVVCVVLSLLPVGLGMLWMTGLMGWRGIDFNPANIMTLPLVIGIGVTSGIHILNRFAEEQSPTILSKSTGKAVLLSALTTVAGFGSLLLAKHQGIASLGFVMAVGTSTCLIAALTFFPSLLNFLTKRGWGIKKPSAENALSTLGLGGTEARNPK